MLRRIFLIEAPIMQRTSTGVNTLLQNEVCYLLGKFHKSIIPLLRSTKFSYNIGLGSFRCLSGTITGTKANENSLTSDNYR